MDASISTAELQQSLRSSTPPLVIDVRRNARFLESPYFLKGALRRDPDRLDDWRQALPEGPKVVYCVHGHEVSQHAARALGARFLEGGIEAWRESGADLARKPQNSATRWVTRERPKIDRIACPWLISRLVDRDAEFLYVPQKAVRDVAQEKEAVPYDVPDVHFTHEGELCSLDAFIKHYGLGGDPALQKLAVIVRGADTGRHELSRQAAGLMAMSLGLSRIFPDDHEMLTHGMVLYDALYSWSKDGQDEVHTWNPEAYR